MGKGAVEIIFRQDIGDTEKIDQRTKYQERFANPFVAGSLAYRRCDYAPEHPPRAVPDLAKKEGILEVNIPL